jgi:hypothetical protein
MYQASMSAVGCTPFSGLRLSLGSGSGSGLSYPNLALSANCGFVLVLEGHTVKLELDLFHFKIIITGSC